MEATAKTLRRALFLDRDGVINTDFGYVCTPDRTEWVPGIFDVCRKARSLDMELVVVTNQAGIARGYYTETEFQRYTRWMLDQFLQRGIDIRAVYHCPHHPEFGIGALKTECACRKPAPGMILQSAQELYLDLAGSAMVGDKVSDMKAATSARIGLRMLLGDDGAEQDDLPGVRRVRSLPEAAMVLETWRNNGDRQGDV